MRNLASALLTSALLAAGVLHTGCSSFSADPTRAEKEDALADARARWESEPDSVEACVWVGRRLGYLGRYEEAVATFTRGLELYPDDPWLLRFRGHRWITLRRFDDAVRDLERARELVQGQPDVVEPDGEPNKAGVPIGTLHSNIDYHLGLALGLRGDDERSAEIWLAGLPAARANEDRLVSHSYWTWLALKRLGRDAEAAQVLAPIRPTMNILENEGYHALLLHFRGEISREELLKGVVPGTTEFATRAYGAGRKARIDGDGDAAQILFAEVVKTGPMAAFGCIAAEVEIGRSP